MAEAEIQKNEYLDSQTATDREYENISSERLKLSSKLLVLKELQQSYAGYSEGVRSLLKSYERGEIGLCRGLRAWWLI